MIYPQGCDVCNHLSLFLCVANHDKLLPGMLVNCDLYIFLCNLNHFSCFLVYLIFPLLFFFFLSFFVCVKTGWGHFAQFTIAVVNKDPKKSKYSGWLETYLQSYLNVVLVILIGSPLMLNKLILQIHYIDSGRKSMIGDGKNLWSYLKC